MSVCVLTIFLKYIHILSYVVVVVEVVALFSAANI